MAIDALQTEADTDDAPADPDAAAGLPSDLPTNLAVDLLRLARGLRPSDIGEVTSRTNAMAIALNGALQVSAADAPAVSTGIIVGASELHASAA